MTLIDTNVLVDVLANDPKWVGWSVSQLDTLRRLGPLFINETIYAETAAGMTAENELKEALRDLRISLERTPTPALFLAGQAFAAYRKSGGTRTGVLPDFFIGAHATVLRLPILTRDVRRFRSYFPKVTLLTPEPA